MGACGAGLPGGEDIPVMLDVRAGASVPVGVSTVNVDTRVSVTEHVLVELQLGGNGRGCRCPVRYVRDFCQDDVDHWPAFRS